MLDRELIKPADTVKGRCEVFGTSPHGRNHHAMQFLRTDQTGLDHLAKGFIDRFVQLLVTKIAAVIERHGEHDEAPAAAEFFGTVREECPPVVRSLMRESVTDGYVPAIRHLHLVRNERGHAAQPLYGPRAPSQSDVVRRQELLVERSSDYGWENGGVGEEIAVRIYRKGLK